MKPVEEFLNLYNNIDSLKNNQINELYIATNDLYSDVCKTDDMKKIYEKIFKNYDPKTIYTIINDPTLQNYKNRTEMIDAKKLFFISYCVLLFFKNSYNMKKEEFHDYLTTLMDRFDLDKNSKLRKAIEKEIGVNNNSVVSKSSILPITTQASLKSSAATTTVKSPPTTTVKTPPATVYSATSKNTNTTTSNTDLDKIINNFIDNKSNDYDDLLNELNKINNKDVSNYTELIKTFKQNNIVLVSNDQLGLKAHDPFYVKLHNYMTLREKILQQLISCEFIFITMHETTPTLNTNLFTENEIILKKNMLKIQSNKELNENILDDIITSAQSISINNENKTKMVKNIFKKIKDKVKELIDKNNNVMKLDCTEINKIITIKITIIKLIRFFKIIYNKYSHADEALDYNNIVLYLQILEKVIKFNKTDEVLTIIEDINKSNVTNETKETFTNYINCKLK